MGKSEKIKSIKIRNNKLLGIFTSNGFNVYLIGFTNPRVVLDNSYLIPCFVNDFTLHFAKSLYSNEMIKSVRLDKEVAITSYELQEILSMCELQPVYKVRLKNTGMYLVGYNFDRSDDGKVILKYPVFAMHRPYIYFQLNKAQEDSEFLLSEGYEIEIETTDVGNYVSQSGVNANNYYE
jgi:hypothetical protein